METFMVIGDSITDGRNTTNGNNRPTTRTHSPDGNRNPLDGLSPNAFERIERDVLAHSGVGSAVIFKAVNDIGLATAANVSLVTEMVIQAYKQIAARAHTFGILLLGATITPFFGRAYLTEEHQAARAKVNERIRTRRREEGVFDAVIDFDEAVRDPGGGRTLNLVLYPTKDGLDLNPETFGALAGAIESMLFEEFNDVMLPLLPSAMLY
ncbi:hypothetical protein V5O48_011846 [Marasmius crinis-equi]|uniref:SGNH hydrolase-type esterase domain-containing protein n=1 Tax=Marasmius crinis-equi TaxID=585013 RepID=A0ABR3F4H5_9AGAR